MELKIAGRTVTIDTENLSKGVYEMHEENDCLGPLAFGMLDAKIIEVFEKELLERFKEEWKGHYYVHEDQIKQFHRDCVKEVCVGIYKRAKMVV